MVKWTKSLNWAVPFITILEIKNNVWVTMNNDFWGHEWGDLPIIFTSDEVTSENHWQIASRVTQKSLLMVTNALFYFLHTIWCSEHTIPLKQLSFADFAIVAKDSLFWLVLWRHHSWSVTSSECRTLALWCHIRRLFLHLQICAKAIFTSE